LVWKEKSRRQQIAASQRRRTAQQKRRDLLTQSSSSSSSSSVSSPKMDTKPIVLIVNDNDDDAKEIVSHIISSRKKYNIIISATTKDAMDQVRKMGSQIVAVVTDMTRIEKGVANHNAGIELARQLRQHSYQMPINFFFQSSSFNSNLVADLAPWAATTRMPDLIEWILSI